MKLPPSSGPVGRLRIQGLGLGVERAAIIWHACVFLITHLRHSLKQFCVPLTQPLLCLPQAGFQVLEPLLCFAVLPFDLLLPSLGSPRTPAFLLSFTLEPLYLGAELSDIGVPLTQFT